MLIQVLLREFSGVTHSVFSTVMLSFKGESQIETYETLVTFKEMTEEEIERSMFYQKRSW